VLALDEKKDVSSVVKPIKPITVDLSDDDEDDCLEVLELPVKAAPKPSNCNNFQKAATVSYASKCSCISLLTRRLLHISTFFQLIKVGIFPKIHLLILEQLLISRI